VGGTGVKVAVGATGVKVAVGGTGVKVAVGSTGVGVAVTPGVGVHVFVGRIDTCANDIHGLAPFSTKVKSSAVIAMPITK